MYNILTKITNYQSILSGDNFLFLLENFEPEMKLNICHTIMQQLLEQKDKITDLYLSLSLLKIGKFIYVFDPEQKKRNFRNFNKIHKKNRFWNRFRKLFNFFN